MQGEQFSASTTTKKTASPFRVIDEVKELWSMALPITAMNVTIGIRYMISVFCLGRLGSLELAGGALALCFIIITGNSVLFGLASGLDPVCSQAHGCKNSDLVISSLHRIILILLIASLPISLMWLNISKIMLLLGQDSQITAIATTYIFYSLPYLLIHSFLQPIRAYLRSKGVTKPMMYCSVGALIVDVPLNLLLVFVLKWGVPGVAIAALLSDLNMVLILIGYLYFSKGDELTWRGWSTFRFDQLWPLVALAVPSCCGICLEWWCYEIMMLISGYLPEPRVAVSTTEILMQTANIMYIVGLSLGSCASTRVGNELGAGKPQKAKFAAMVALVCALLIGTLNVTWTTVFRRQWAVIFTKDNLVIALTASAMPIVGLAELGNGTQTTGCGILRGAARPAIGARINLISFYVIGMPLAIGLTFWLQVGYKGIWLGLLTAEIVCALSVLFMVIRTDWEVEADRAKKLTTVAELERHLLIDRNDV